MPHGTPKPRGYPRDTAGPDSSLPLDFCPPTAAEAQRARALIGDMRLEVLHALLRASLRHPDTARLRAAIAACLDRDPEALVAFASRWDVAFGLSRLVESESPSLARRLLLAMQLSDDDRVRRHVLGHWVAPLGRRDLALGFVSLGGVLRPVSGDRIVAVHRSKEHLEVHTAHGLRHRVVAPMRPGRRISGLAFEPYVTAFSWRPPIFETDDFAIPSAVLHGHAPTSVRTRWSRTRPAQLPASLAHACEILQGVWPAVPSWLRLLVPAVLRVRRVAASAPRLSGSFGPGYPIYLSETTELHLHAEDLVHELQHLRFQIWRATIGWPPPSPDGERFVSPFRPDLRPLLGVHLGLHAFMTVNDLRLHESRPLPLTAAVLADTAVTHQRNLFAFQTVSSYESRSLEGDRYLRAVAARLDRQHDAITQLATKAVRLRATRALNRHLHRATAAGPAVNAALEAAWRRPAIQPRRVGGRA